MISKEWEACKARPRIPLDTPERYAAALGQVHAAAEKAGRDPAKIAAAILAIKSSLGPEQKNPDGTRMTFTGDAQAIVDDIGGFQDIGLQHFLIGGDGSDLPGTIERMEEFSSEVMAKFT